MRWPRPRFTVRRLMVAVAIGAFLTAGCIWAGKWERIFSASREYDEILKRDEEGRVTLVQIIESSRRLMDARLAVCLTQNGRDAVIAAHVERADRMIDRERNAPPELHD